MQLKFLLELRESGEDPKALRDRPELDFRQAYYYGVYRTLQRERPVGGMGVPLPLPVTSLVKNHCELFYISNLTERERLVHYVSVLDDAYLEHAAEQREAAKRD